MRVCVRGGLQPCPGHMQLSEDRTEILVNGKPKYSARSIRFVLGVDSDACVLCTAAAALAAGGGVSSRCTECGELPNPTVLPGFRLSEHRLDGKMRKPRPRELTAIEPDDFDNEARLLFQSLGLDESGRGNIDADKYCPMNEIHRRYPPFPLRRPPHHPVLVRDCCAAEARVRARFT